MTKALPIQHLLFDIGNVLVHLDYEKGWRDFLAECDAPEGEAPPLSLSHKDPMIGQYERGEVSTEAVYRYFAEKTGFHGSQAQFESIWCGVFYLNKPMVDYARMLSGQFDVYFLTNSGPLHIPRLYEAFPELQFFKDDAVSYRLGVLKPEPGFYEKALEKFGLEPDACLFVDDLEERGRGAGGWIAGSAVHLL